MNEVDEALDTNEADLDASLREGYKKFKETAETEETAAEPAHGKAVPETDRQTAEDARPVVEKIKPDRTRAPDGKFAPTQEKPAAEAMPAAPAKRRAPQTWRKEAQEKWDALDPQVQEEVEKREQDAMNGINHYKTRGEAAEIWDRALAPYQATIQSMGIAPQRAAQALFAADHALRYGSPQQKLAMLQKLVKDYGIQMEGLPDPEQEDPRFTAQQDRINRLEQHLAKQDQQRQQHEQNTAKTALDDFKKNAQHLDAVRDDMAALLETGRASNLQDAYDKAVWGKAELREALIAEQLRARQEETAKVTSDARKASSVNVPAKGKVAGGAPKGSMDDDIQAGVKRMGLFT